MSRKRYLSSEVSTDSRMRKLAEQSEFAALLYTWMIPHAGDDAMMTADPDELLMQVVPGFRWRTADDVAQAVDLMVSLGLLERRGDRLRFPPSSFYKYQSYIGDGRRADQNGVQHDTPEEDQRETPQPSPPTPDPSAEQRVSPQNAADKNFAPEPPQNRASSSSSSVALKSATPVPPNPQSAADGAPPRRAGPAPPRANGTNPRALGTNPRAAHALEIPTDDSGEEPTHGPQSIAQQCPMCAQTFIGPYADHRCPISRPPRSLGSVLGRARPKPLSGTEREQIEAELAEMAQRKAEFAAVPLSPELAAEDARLRALERARQQPQSEEQSSA